MVEARVDARVDALGVARVDSTVDAFVKLSLERERESLVMETKKIGTLVLDAGPLITQSASTLQQFAEKFYTTPGVYEELKDEFARQQLWVWGDRLQVRQPKRESIRRIVQFSRLTGDYGVLSANDLHVMALAYELEREENGDWRLRRFPGEKIKFKRFTSQTSQTEGLTGEDQVDKTKAALEAAEAAFGDREENKEEDAKESVKENMKEDIKENTNDIKENIKDIKDIKESEGGDIVKSKKPRRRGGKKQREKRLAQLQIEREREPKNGEQQQEKGLQQEEEEQDEEKDRVDSKIHSLKGDFSSLDTDPETDSNPKSNQIAETSNQELLQEYDEDDDNGEWITPDNLFEELLKNDHEQLEEAKTSAVTGPFIKVALATGDFACQNVSMQLGLNLMNSMSGKQIKRVRNYMYRCYACFRLTPLPKDGTPKHFCPKCGGNTLLRCAVSVDNITGKVTPHLKANFQWVKRGQRYSLPSPLSKNQQKLQGNAGYQHNKQNRHKSLQENLILREDQKEYETALKNDEWQRRQNEKLLEDWIGGGSADNYVSPFTSSHTRSSGVRVGRGRYVNSSRGKKHK